MRATQYCRVLRIPLETLEELATEFPDIHALLHEMGVTGRRNMARMRWRMVWHKHRIQILREAESMVTPEEPWPYAALVVTDLPDQPAPDEAQAARLSTVHAHALAAETGGLGSPLEREVERRRASRGSGQALEPELEATLLGSAKAGVMSEVSMGSASVRSGATTPAPECEAGEGLEAVRPHDVDEEDAHLKKRRESKRKQREEPVPPPPLPPLEGNGRFSMLRGV